MSRLRQIAQLGAEVLRQTAVPVKHINAPATRAIIDDMLYTLEDSTGVGLAAPQIYESQRIVIIASRPTPRYPYAPEMPATVMINPEFQAEDSQREKDWEGCLSIPGIRALVPRYKSIMVTYTDTTGQQQKLQCENFVARVFQHEFDHLDGIVYLDRVENNRDIYSEKEFLKRIS